MRVNPPPAPPVLCWVPTKGPAVPEDVPEALAEELPDALVADADEPEREADLQSVKPGRPLARAGRRRLTIRGEFALATLPTLTVLIVFGLIDVLSNQKLLFASLASSAFLIYLDPEHGTNRVKTLTIAQLLAAGFGYVTYALVPAHLYLSGGIAMVATIVSMILLDAVHPPAVSTSLAFAFHSESASNLTIFALAVGVTAVLVLLQRGAVWVLAKHAWHDAKEART